VWKAPPGHHEGAVDAGKGASVEMLPASSACVTSLKDRARGSCLVADRSARQDERVPLTGCVTRRLN
jgi:hypothetical protein